MAKRFKTVEYVAGWGYIARNPWTGEEVIKDFFWCTREVARSVVWEARLLDKPATVDSEAT